MPFLASLRCPFALCLRSLQLALTSEFFQKHTVPPAFLPGFAALSLFRQRLLEPGRRRAFARQNVLCAALLASAQIHGSPHGAARQAARYFSRLGNSMSCLKLGDHPQCGFHARQPWRPLLRLFRRPGRVQICSPANFNCCMGAKPCKLPSGHAESGACACRQRCAPFSPHPRRAGEIFPRTAGCA